MDGSCKTTAAASTRHGYFMSSAAADAAVPSDTTPMANAAVSSIIQMRPLSMPNLKRIGNCTAI